ncbi:MAG TPA: hypothetical protein VL738_43245 [Dactylosporangium sp.]|nr:hypothetical protein [Dactylosporangium sp.]
MTAFDIGTRVRIVMPPNMRGKFGTVEDTFSDGCPFRGVRIDGQTSPVPLAFRIHELELARGGAS